MSEIEELRAENELLRDVNRGWWQAFVAALECGDARRSHIICRRNQKARATTRRRYGR